MFRGKKRREPEEGSIGIWLAVGKGALTNSAKTAGAMAWSAASSRYNELAWSENCGEANEKMGG
ncbi:MAG: hypothetical protein WCD49_05280 [Candidatus Acidiferrales bacterium]